MNGTEVIKALPEVQEIEQSTSAFLNMVLAIRVIDADSFKLANGLFLDANNRIKAIDEKLDPKRDLAYRAYQEWLKLIKELKDPYLEGKTHLNVQMTAYKQEQDRIQREERERLRQIAVKEEMERRQVEEKRRMEEAAILEQAGAKEEAEQVMAEVLQENEAPIIVVPPPPVTLKIETRGMGTQTTWTFEIVNKELIPRQYLTPDMVKIGGIVRALKDATNIPGIKVISQSKMKATGR